MEIGPPSLPPFQADFQAPIIQPALEQQYIALTALRLKAPGLIMAAQYPALHLTQKNPERGVS